MSNWRPPYQIVFELNGLPQMTNPASGASRSNFWAKAKEAKKWKQLVGFVTLGKRPPAPLKKAKLTLTRFSSSAPDADGLVSGFKHVIDGLVDAGILENDRWVNIGMPEYRWEKCAPKAGRILVIVDEVSDLPVERPAKLGEMESGASR